MPFKHDPDEAVLRRQDIQSGTLARAGRRLLGETAIACSAQEATLWLISPDGKQMDGTLNHGKTPHILEKASVDVTRSVVGMVAASGLATSIGPGDPHDTSVDRDTGLPVTAMIVAPVYARGKLCGALSAINPLATQGPAPTIFHAQAMEMLQWKAFLMGLVLSEHLSASEQG